MEQYLTIFFDKLLPHVIAYHKEEFYFLVNKYQRILSIVPFVSWISGVVSSEINKVQLEYFYVHVRQVSNTHTVNT